MDISKYNAIVSKNLKRIAYQHEKTQTDIARDLNISKATVSSWMNGTRLPLSKRTAESRINTAFLRD